MRRLGETAQNRMFLGPGFFYLVGSQSQDLKGPTLVRDETSDVRSKEALGGCATVAAMILGGGVGGDGGTT